MTVSKLICPPCDEAAHDECMAPAGSRCLCECRFNNGARARRAERRRKRRIQNIPDPSRWDKDFEFHHNLASFQEQLRRGKVS